MAYNLEKLSEYIKYRKEENYFLDYLNPHNDNKCRFRIGNLPDGKQAIFLFENASPKYQLSRDANLDNYYTFSGCECVYLIRDNNGDIVNAPLTENNIYKLEDIEEYLKDKYVLEFEDEIADLSFENDSSNPDTLNLNVLSVFKRYRNSGIGSKLLSDLDKIAIGRGKSIIVGDGAPFDDPQIYKMSQTQKEMVDEAIATSGIDYPIVEVSRSLMLFYLRNGYKIDKQPNPSYNKMFVIKKQISPDLNLSNNEKAFFAGERNCLDEDFICLG